MKFQFAVSLHTFYETTLEEFRDGDQMMEVDEMLLKQTAADQQKEFDVGIQPMDLVDLSCLEDQLEACEKLLQHWLQVVPEDAPTRVIHADTELASTGQWMLENIQVTLEAYAECEIIEEDGVNDDDDFVFDDSDTMRICHGVLDETKPAEPTLQVIRSGLLAVLRTGVWDCVEALQATALLVFGKELTAEHAEQLREMLTDTSGKYTALCSSYRQIGRIPTEEELVSASDLSSANTQVL